MAIEKTLSIIKPDAVGKNLIGKIISRFEDNGLCVVAAKLIHLSDDMACCIFLICRSVEERYLCMLDNKRLASP